MMRPALLVLASACWLTATAQRLSVTAPKVNAPPALDGDLSDPCWQEAQATGGFVHPQSGQPAGQPTEFRMVRTDRALYVGVLAHDFAAAQIEARYAEHDGPLWGDDCVEVFLAPADDGMEYVQVIANTLGATWDAYVTQMGVSSDASFETGARAAATTGADSWSVEIEIPYAGLDLKQGTGAAWGLNVAREKKTEPSELSCWVHTGVEKFGIPTKFGLLDLAGATFDAFAWDVSGFRLLNPRFRDDGKADAELACEVRNLGARAQEATLAVTLVDEANRTISASAETAVAAGAVAQVRLPLAIEDTVTAVRYRLTDADSGALLSLGAKAVRLTCTPLELRLLAPWYRDTIFASCPVDAIEAEAVVHGDRKQAFTVVLEGDSGRRNAIALEVRPGKPSTIRIPANDLAVGNWRLALLREDGTSAAERTIRVLPPHAGEVCLDRRARLLNDGRPFFPWGFMSAGPDERVAKAGFNTIHTYVGFYIHRDRDLPAWLDKCQALGLKATMYCYPGEVGIHINRNKKEFTDPELERIGEFVTKYRDHPAIIGWYLCDEPRGRVLRAEMKRVHDVVARADPFHPCIVLDNTGRGVAELADAGEVLWVDPYPGFAKDGPPRLPLSMVAIAMDDMIRVTGTRLRHFWVAPQAFNWGAWGGPKEKTERAPTYAEERTMTYLSIVHGAQGVVYFAWKYVLREPELEKGLLERLGPEIRALTPELLEGEDVDGVTTACTPPDLPLHVRTIKRDGRFTVIAVNPSQQSLGAAITVPGLGSRQMEVVSEDRSVNARSGSFRDRFSPAATHVYQSD